MNIQCKLERKRVVPFECAKAHSLLHWAAYVLEAHVWKCFQTG